MDQRILVLVDLHNTCSIPEHVAASHLVHVVTPCMHACMHASIPMALGVHGVHALTNLQLHGLLLIGEKQSVLIGRQELFPSVCSVCSLGFPQRHTRHTCRCTHYRSRLLRLAFACNAVRRIGPRKYRERTHCRTSRIRPFIDVFVEDEILSARSNPAHSTQYAHGSEQSDTSAHLRSQSSSAHRPETHGACEAAQRAINQNGGQALKFSGHQTHTAFLLVMRVKFSSSYCLFSSSYFHEAAAAQQAMNHPQQQTTKSAIKH
jgi:hypothetical protein